MIGTAVGNFRIIRQLGKGGMGEVWEAEQESIKTKVAIKLLRADVSADASHVQRFFNEAVAVSKIRHAGIVKIFDVGFLGTQAYLVMELLEGETLTRRITRTGRLAVREACEIARQVAGVLDATHAAGIIHRDLKPDNVFLVPDAELPSGERAKVLDFGIAKLGSVGITSTSVSSMGTPLYMSPEQWRSVAKVDGRTDAYSLGCVVFEMACGRPPFLAASIGEACSMHLTDPPPAVSSLVPDVAPAFDQLVARLLEKDPAQRPTMREAMAAFEAIAQGLPRSAPWAHAPAAPAGAAAPPVAATVVTAPGVPAPVSPRAATVATAGAVPAPAPSPVAATVAPVVSGVAATAGPAPAGVAATMAPAPSGVAATATAGPAPSGVAATMTPDLERAATAPATPPRPVTETTLGGSAGSTQMPVARRGRIGRIAGVLAVLAAGATAAVLVLRARDGGDSPAVTPAPAPRPEPAPAPAPPPAPPDEPPPAPPPPARADLPLVSAGAARRISGDPPKNLPVLVDAHLCIDAAGAVTDVRVGEDVEKAVADTVTSKLKTWRYEPYKRDGEPIAVCFPTRVRPRVPDPVPGKPGTGSAGTGSGSGKPSDPPPGPGSGSGKPTPGPGSGSGKPPPDPPPGPGSGSGSGKPPPPPPLEQVTQAEFAAAMKKVEPGVRKCRDQLVIRGQVQVQVRVNPRGTPTVTVLAPARPRPINCIKTAVQKATFPATKRGGTFEHRFDP